MVVSLLQSGERNDEMREWLEKIEEVLNNKTIEYKFEKEFEMIDSDNYIKCSHN